MPLTQQMDTLNSCPPSEAQWTARARAALSQVRHFAELPPGIQEALAAGAMPRHFHAGQVIYLEGEPAETMYFLEKGWIKATRMSPEGREQAMLFLRAGDVFGDVALLTDTPYPGTVVALEPVDVWAIEKPVILELISRNPELAMAVIRLLGERLLYYVGLVEDLSLRSVEARLAKTLLRHADLCAGRLTVRRRTWATFD